MRRAKARGRQIRGRTDPNYFTAAGPVKVTQADGTVYEQLPYDKNQLQRVVKVRAHITPKLRQRIMRRDRWRCRYCGSRVGPFDIDHVVPIALGGSNQTRNLVTACASCNSRKGANVWKPRPIGG